MTSKLLLGFNAFMVLGAYLLYACGVRLILDDGYDELELQEVMYNFQPVAITKASSPASSGSWGGSGEQANYTCTNLRMQPKFLSYDPVMVYIENFMSPFETQHLRELA